MANLLALENTISEDASDEVESEDQEVEETESEGAEEFEGHELGETDESEDESEEAEALAAAELDPKATYKVGEEEVSGEELLKGRLRQADYTQKTQKLAEDRKKLTSERDEAVEKAEDIIAWVKSLADTDNLEAELDGFFPEALEKLRQRWIEEELELQDMDEKVAAVHRKNRKHELERRRLANQQKESERIAERKNMAIKTAELRKSVESWTNSAVKAVGLDPENADHMQMVMEKVAAQYRGVKWTEATFHEAAKSVARVLGIKKPEQAAAGAKPKAKLPPVKDLGHRGPKERDKAPKRKAVDPGDFFASLRKKHGVA